MYACLPVLKKREIITGGLKRARLKAFLFYCARVLNERGVGIGEGVRKSGGVRISGGVGISGVL